MSVIRHIFLLFLALSMLPAIAQSFTFDTPNGWSVKWEPDKKNKSSAPNAIFSSDTDKMTANISILKGRDVSAMSSTQLQGVLVAMAEDSVPKSLEGKAVPSAFGTTSGGMYIRLTDKDTQANFKYITYAIHRKGPHLSLGVMTSNDNDAALLAKFFSIFESLSVGTEQPAAKTVPDITASDIVWGAIASDANMTDNDPIYGFGEGDTRAEAEDDARNTCLKEGAKRCVVRIVYTQCGAFAVSGSGKSWSWGTGVTKRAAERNALGTCKGVGCEIVASDCN